MLNSAQDSQAVSLGEWDYLLAPGIAIVLVVLAFTWCGNALEKVLNPRLAGAVTAMTLFETKNLA